jgi:hypothetical protein
VLGERTEVISSQQQARRDRANLLLPDSTRIAWTSDQARIVWEPRFALIRKAWARIEWLSVASGIRQCAVTQLSPEQLALQAPEWAGRGLAALPFALDRKGDGSYQNAIRKPEANAAVALRVAIGTVEDVAAIKCSMDAHDDDKVGDMLGYPACCRRFFREAWYRGGLRDTSWPMAVNSGAQDDGAETIDVEGFDLANVLWRWTGVRAVPHLPCSLACAATSGLGSQMMDVGTRAGFEEQVQWIRAILSWPVEWSALHGVAEIKTPILRISTRTDFTEKKRTIRRRGSSYPAEGAQGIRFPYSRPAKLRLSESNAYARGLRTIGVSSAHLDWYATDNGFKTASAMEKAHTAVLTLASQELAARGGNVIDLGCGNGALLKRICDGHTTLYPFGVDEHVDKIDHARELMPVYRQNFYAADMFDDDWKMAGSRRYALAIMMPQRMSKAGSERAQRLASWLKQHCDLLLCYQYSDSELEPIEASVASAGFLAVGPAMTTTASSAVFATFNDIPETTRLGMKGEELKTTSKKGNLGNGN